MPSEIGSVIGQDSDLLTKTEIESCFVGQANKTRSQPAYECKIAASVQPPKARSRPGASNASMMQEPPRSMVSEFSEDDFFLEDNNAGDSVESSLKSREPRAKSSSSSKECVNLTELNTYLSKLDIDNTHGTTTDKLVDANIAHYLNTNKPKQYDHIVRNVSPSTYISDSDMSQFDSVSCVNQSFDIPISPLEKKIIRQIQVSYPFSLFFDCKINT